MGNMPESFSAVVADLVARIEKLEKEVAELRGEASGASVAEDAPVVMDFPDIKGFDEVQDFPESGNKEVPEEVTLEDVPEESVAEEETATRDILEEPVSEPVIAGDVTVISGETEIILDDIPENEIQEAAVEDITEENTDDDTAFVTEEESASAEEVIDEKATAVETVPEDLPDAENRPDKNCSPAVQESETAMETDESAWDAVSLFGDEEPAAAAPVRRRGMKETINDEAPAKKTVLDAMTDNSAWRHDIPGPEVRELRSAIGLGDKVYFCHALFRDDNALYQDTVLKLNAMKKLDDAVEYLRATFPEWDWNSDKVYRFMMAVRRKVRN